MSGTYLLVLLFRLFRFKPIIFENTIQIILVSVSHYCPSSRKRLLILYLIGFERSYWYTTNMGNPDEFVICCTSATVYSCLRCQRTGLMIVQFTSLGVFNVIIVAISSCPGNEYANQLNPLRTCEKSVEFIVRFTHRLLD